MPFFLTDINYAVIFGAFAGSIFYVATEANATRCRLAAYFVSSFIVGVLGAEFIGSRLAAWTGYNETPLDALGSVLISALIIKTLKFLNSQEFIHLFKTVTRQKDRDGHSGKK